VYAQIKQGDGVLRECEGWLRLPTILSGVENEKEKAL
jgi:hypothetical protein